MQGIELRIARKNTLSFIRHNPTQIILVPVERVEQPSGGYKERDLPPRAEQTFRIVEQGLNNLGAPIVRTTDGRQREVEFMLLGAHDAQVSVDDHWTALDGREWEVADIIRSNNYETRAMVVERGK